MRLPPQSLLVSILMVFGVGAGCTPSSQLETEANSRLVLQFIAATDAKNFSAYDEVLSPEMIQHSPGGLDLDRDQIEAAEREFAEAFPDASRTVDFLLADPDRVMIRETFRGTHRGEFQGIPATGSPVELTANIVYRISDGKVAESWVELDLPGLTSSLEQAGSRNFDVPGAGQSTANARAEVEERFKAWADTEVDGDVEAWLQFLAEDVVLQPNNHPPVHGKASAREFFADFFQTPVSVMEPQNTQVVVSESGDVAANFGDLRVMFENSDQELTMKSAVVWRKQGADWKVVLNSWSTNE